jgi:hypothetical protein
MHGTHAVTIMEAVMPLDAISNVLPFPSNHLSRRDRALIEEWRLSAASLGVAGVDVRDDLPDTRAPAVGDRITIRFRRGVADGQFAVIQRPVGAREWVTLSLRVEADCTLPSETGQAIRHDRTLRDALNAVRPVLPDQDCRLFDYSAARRAARALHTGHADGSMANAT